MKRGGKMRTSTRKKIVKLQSNVPGALRKYKQWVAWRSSNETGREQKIPIDPVTGKNASVSDPKTWTSFERAIDFLKKGQADGIGFVLTKDDPFVAVDLDDCVDAAGCVGDEIWAYIQAQHSYVELSPSNTGLHVWVHGEIPRNVRKNGTEVYAKDRFMTATGRRVKGSAVEIGSGGIVLKDLYSKLTEEKRSVGEKSLVAVQTPDAQLERIIEEAGSGQNGAKFKRIAIAGSFRQGRQARDRYSQDESGDPSRNDRHNAVAGKFFHEPVQGIRLHRL
jgi:primase-polymerase (primpol)-like protein